MKKNIVIGIFFLIFSFFIVGKLASDEVENSFKALNEKVQQTFKDGDIIFQTSESEQCEAVRIATNSKFSHCGILFHENKKLYVYEAIQPVKKTLFEDWIKHGKDGKYLIMRLKDTSLLNENAINKMKSYAKELFNKDYDIYFEWSNDKIYCSEYVWKIYKEAAYIDLCELGKLKDFNLEHPKVKAILKERYGNNIPLEESVIAPSQLAKSKKLITVFDIY
jgi:hypothetical protein